MQIIGQLSDLLGQILVAKGASPTLYTICGHALELTGARNAMLAFFNEREGYMTLRAGVGADWKPAMLGEKISVGDEQEEGITAYVAATGQSFLSRDVRAESRYRRLIEGTRSELASPIRDSHARIRGVLNVESDEVGKFDEDDQAHLELLALVAGIALDREDGEVRREALLEVVTALEEAKTEEDLLKRVGLVTQSMLKVSAYSIFLWDERAQAFVLRDTVGSSTLDSDAHYLPGEGATGWVCQHGEPVRLSAPIRDQRWRGKYLEFPLEEISAFISVPILSSGKCMGCMRALRKKPENTYIDNRFTEDDERLLLAIAEQLGVGLDNMRSVRRLVQSERMAAWGELSAKSSHMIGNRVFALKGDLNELRFLLDEPEGNQEKVRDVVNSLDQGLERLDEILHEFRDFVSATRLTEAEGDLNESVQSAAKALVPASSPVKLRFELESGLPPFAFDEYKVERAVAELVENSLHFVEKGEIVVRTRLATEDDLLHAKWTSRAGDFALIEIEDRGPGVPEGNKADIFQPYHSTRTRGMGLGLSIVKGIVDAHGGRVYESGEPGKGARFVILLPVKQSQPETA